MVGLSQIGQRLAETTVDEVQRLTGSWAGCTEIGLYRTMTDLMIRAVGRSVFGI